MEALREFAEIKNGNVLIIGCLGKSRDGQDYHCAGYLRIPFIPPIGVVPTAVLNEGGTYWKRLSGDSVDNLTLSPSIDAGPCGHFNIINGKVEILHEVNP
jgi:hypothetical protein